MLFTPIYGGYFTDSDAIVYMIHCHWGNPEISDVSVKHGYSSVSLFQIFWVGVSEFIHVEVELDVLTTSYLALQTPS